MRLRVYGHGTGRTMYFVRMKSNDRISNIENAR